MTTVTIDDVRSAAGNGSLLDATLRLMIVRLTGLDEITIRLNGETLDRNTACTRLLYNECWLDFDVSADPALRRVEEELDGLPEGVLPPLAHHLLE